MCREADEQHDNGANTPWLLALLVCMVQPQRNPWSFGSNSWHSNGSSPDGVQVKCGYQITLTNELTFSIFSYAPACWLVFCSFSIKFLRVLWPHTAATGRNPSASTWENFSRCSRQESCLHCTPLLQGVRRKFVFGWWKSCKWSWSRKSALISDRMGGAFLPQVLNSKINGSSWEMRYCNGNDLKNLS